MIRSALAQEPMRYAGISAAVALMNNMVLIGGDRVGLGYVWLVFLSWLIGGILAFGLHSRFTFRVDAKWGGFWRFMAATAMGVPLALGLIALMRSGFGWPMWVASSLATLLMFTYNYASARIAILRKLFAR